MNKQEMIKQIIRIPRMIIIDFILFVIASLLDAFLLPQAGDGSGHPFPYFTVIISFILIIATIVVFFFSIFNVIRIMLRANKKDNPNKPDKKVNPLLPVSISLVLSIMIVFGSGSYEVMNFYNNPDHIGFAIPAGTFLLAGILFIVNIVIAVVSTAAYKRK